MRLIQLQLHAKMPSSDTLREACYKMNASEIDDILLTYADSLLPMRSKERYTVSPEETVINFKALINTINALMRKCEDGTVGDIFGLMPADTYFNYNDKNLMQAFLDDNISNDLALTFFASLQFLEAYPDMGDSEWRNNFAAWIKSFRNMLSNTNNTQRIDKRYRYENAMIAILDMTKDLIKFGNDNLSGPSEQNYVYRFFNYIKDKTYVGIDNQALKEESDKAALILLDQEWASAITLAENDPYLWGQIRALLQWAQGDIVRFKSYSSKLIDLLGLIKEDCNAFYIAALKINPEYWELSNRLYQLNFDRDNSFKRYLRDYDKEQSTNAPLIKNIIDLWMEKAGDLDAREFIDSVITDKNYVYPAWLECILAAPSILNYSNNKRVFIDRGHVIFAQYKTKDSHCIDPVLLYIHNRAVEDDSQKQVTFYDSKGDDPHSVSFEKGEGSYHLKWSDVEGMYELTFPDGSTQTCNVKEAVDMFSKIITDKPFSLSNRVVELI